MSRLSLICAISPTSDTAQLCCSDSSHFHLSHAEVYEREKLGEIVWLVRGASKRAKSVVVVLPAHKAPETGSYSAVDPVNSGLSNKVGEYLAAAICRKEPWARTMLSEMSR